MRKRLLNNLGELVINIFKILFPVSVITFILYFIIENFKVGIISNYFDMHGLLLMALISGFFLLLFNNNKNSYLPFKRVLAIILTLFIIFISYQYLQNIEKMRYFISLLIGIATYIIINLYPSKYDSGR